MKEKTHADYVTLAAVPLRSRLKIDGPHVLLEALADVFEGEADFHAGTGEGVRYQEAAAHLRRAERVFSEDGRPVSRETADPERGSFYAE